MILLVSDGLATALLAAAVVVAALLRTAAFLVALTQRGQHAGGVFRVAGSFGGTETGLVNGGYGCGGTQRGSGDRRHDVAAHHLANADVVAAPLRPLAVAVARTGQRRRRGFVGAQGAFGGGRRALAGVNHGRRHGVLADFPLR